MEFQAVRIETPEGVICHTGDCRCSLGDAFV